MKKLVLFSLLGLAITGNAFAKKVKFAVDMTGQTINATGMHISGSFQDEIGLSADWISDSTSLIQEVADTNIYSIIVDIPAFQLYEYKFLNGDQFYDAEFVPVESRVGYNFNDNRWLYVDSLADDTTFVGNIQFGLNAPANNYLVRFYVDVQALPSVDPAGMHVAGDFQGNNPATTYMYSFGGTLYEIIAYMPAGTYGYKFYNGNTSGASESVPSTCSVNGSRSIDVSKDTLLTQFCFGSCGLCSIGIDESKASVGYSVYPVPASSSFSLEFERNVAPVQITLVDNSGRVVRKIEGFSGNKLHIERNNLANGMYFLSVKNYSGENLLHTQIIFE